MVLFFRLALPCLASSPTSLYVHSDFTAISQAVKARQDRLPHNFPYEFDSCNRSAASITSLGVMV